MTAVTDPLAAPPPVDPDDPRHAIARAKGLEQPVISGGEDPDPGTALAADRHYGKLLVAMVLVIVASGFIIGIALALVGPAGGR
jgi:hypothetical protein